jgi:GNAT superfamily N-acetyltransferase
VIDFQPCDADRRPASDLLAAVLAEFNVQAGRQLRGGPLTTREDFAPPAGVYLVGSVDGAVACGGGIREIGDGVAEVKRMYVVPSFRRRGVGSELLIALEESAREFGHAATRLDCRFAVWPLYRSAGYREIDDYNGNPHAQVWAEKWLTASTA